MERIIEILMYKRDELRSGGGGFNEREETQHKNSDHLDLYDLNVGGTGKTKQFFNSGSI